MADPVEIYLGDPSGEGWSKSIGWTTMSLSRSKDNLTGSLQVTYFYGYVPQEPVEVDAAYGREILVYVDGWLAFVGIIDGRRGTGSNRGGDGEGARTAIGPDEYSVSLTARGKAKQFIDNSHDIHRNMNGFNTQEIVQALSAPWDVEIDWQAEPQNLDICRFRNSARVSDELLRIAREHSHYMYEGRDGRLIVTDGTLPTSGDDLVLGRNILSFSATQSETEAKSEVRVRGQRSAVGQWGEGSVLPPVQKVVGDDLLATSLRQVFVQHYGDATEQSLERRAMYEANKRAKASKSVSIDVFGVASATNPWDIGQLHRVVIPPEGIDTILECTGLRITCGPEELRTSLSLSPMPKGVKGVSSGPLANLPAEDLEEIAQGAGISYVGQYPAPWSVGTWVVENIPVLGDLLDAFSSFTRQIFGGLRNLEGNNGKPPDRID